MTDEGTRYEVTEVKAIRGTEAKTIAGKQQEGWELVTQEPGLLRTTMTFRRPKPEIPWRLVASIGGAGVILAGLITGGVLLAGGGDESAPDAVAASSAAQPSPQPSPEPAAEPAAPETAEILTIDNNEDLARILQDGDACSQAVADFATQYAGRTIQFDGHIAAMNNHGSYKTRYDILVGARDFDESDGRGPNFQFRDVNLVSDINLIGPNIPDTLGVLDTLRVTAVVEEFAERTCLLQLDPVSTESVVLEEAAYVAPAPLMQPDVDTPPVHQAVPEPVVEAPPPPPPAAPEPAPRSASYANCSEVRAAGAAPIYSGDPGYSRKLDRDGDGVACENG